MQLFQALELLARLTSLFRGLEVADYKTPDVPHILAWLFNDQGTQVQDPKPALAEQTPHSRFLLLIFTLIAVLEY